MWKGKAQKTQTAGAYPGFFSMKHLGVLLLSPGREASQSPPPPPQEQYVAGTHTMVKRDKVEKRFSSKKTAQPARLEPRTSRCGVQSVNHPATHAST